MIRPPFAFAERTHRGHNQSGNLPYYCLVETTGVFITVTQVLPDFHKFLRV